MPGGGALTRGGELDAVGGGLVDALSDVEPLVAVDLAVELALLC